MIRLLAKMLIKEYDDIKNSKVREGYGTLCSVIGILLNIFLFLGKYIAGILTGSIAVTADAFNNLSDAGSSFIALVGFRIAGKKADKDHPFGHGRIEYIAGLAVSALILLMGVELGKTSIKKIINPEPVVFEPVAVVILAVAILVKLYMFFVNRGVAKKINSATLKATAMDSLGDVAATSVVLVSVIIGHFFGVSIDGWCGLLVTAVILWAGYQAAKDTVSPLLGQPPEPEFVQQINDLVMSHEEIIGIHDMIIHDYGPGRRLVSLHGEVDGSKDIYVLHEAIDHIEKELTAALGCEAVIHMDPVIVGDPVVDQMKRDMQNAVSVLGETISIHDFRMVGGVNCHNVIFDIVIPYETDLDEEQVRREVGQIAKNLWGEGYQVVLTIDREYVL